MTMTPDDLQDLEIALLAEGIFRVYGYDFREYAEASRRRRMQAWLGSSGFATISDALIWISPYFSLNERFATSFFISG